MPDTQSSEAFHAEFKRISDELLEPARYPLLEGPSTVTRESLLAQLLMNELARGGDPEDLDLTFDGKFNAAQKASFCRLADHMGPDWAQALYHAAVFITRVA